MIPIIYLISIADNVREVGNFFSGISVFVILYLFCIAWVAGIEAGASREEFSTIFKRGIPSKGWQALVIFIITLGFLIKMFVPDTEKLAAAYFASSVISNEEISKVPTKVFELLNIKLEDIKQEIESK